MPDYWHIVDSQASMMFSSLAAVLRLRGTLITQARTRDLIKIDVSDGHSYYIKRFYESGKGLRAYGGRSRARAEWENLQYFRSLGLNAPRLVSYGELRSGLNYVAGAYVMRELPNVVALPDAMNVPDFAQDRVWRHHVLQGIAKAVALLHEQGFIHRDLYWRNILVSTEADHKIFLIDCPAGRFQWGPFFNYGRIRDLACFYKDSHRYFSRTELMRCFLTYVGHKHLTPADKKLLRQLFQRMQPAPK